MRTMDSDAPRSPARPALSPPRVRMKTILPHPMSAQPDLSKLSVGQFAERFRGEMIPLSNTFSYFCASGPLSEEGVNEYLEEPIAALPPAISALLPKVSIMLVPYLERVDGKEKGTLRRDEFVVTEKPPDSRASCCNELDRCATLRLHTL